jgi:hypothetical protein
MKRKLTTVTREMVRTGCEHGLKVKAAKASDGKKSSIDVVSFNYDNKTIRTEFNKKNKAEAK